MNKIYLWISIGIIIISINISKSFTGIQSYRSIYVYDLIKNTNWPEYDAKDKFVIGVLGNSSVLAELKDLSTKRKAGSRSIVINEIKNLASIEGCNLIYISPENSSKVEEITEKVKNKGILVITEAPGMLEKGAPINFISHHGKLKYEINESAALQARLTFSEHILSKAIAVN